MTVHATPAQTLGMTTGTGKRPRDRNLLAKFVVDRTVDRIEHEPRKVKDPASVAYGSIGGKKGGPARAAKLSAKTLAEIGKTGARTRWAKT